MYATTESSRFRFTSNFARGASSISARGPLTDDQIRTVAPSVFADEAHDSRSKRYAYIPTIDVLQGLRREGFEVFSATQARTRIEGRGEHTKHMLRLRHVSQLSRADADSTPELVLLNSHDGSSSYQLMGGVFRMVCANGLIVPDGTCQTVKVQHSGQVRDKVTEGAYEVLDGLTRVIDSRDGMRALTLSTDEQRLFANAAAQIRFEPGEGEQAPVTADQVNRPRRHADAGADLWTTFNRVQENVTKGGLRGTTVDANGRRHHRATRAVTGIDQDVRLNRALWTLAEEMRKLKTAA